MEAEGFDPVEVSGTEILADSTAIQPVSLTPAGEGTPPENPIVIPDHTLYGNYPPKIAETEVKPVRESGEIVLSRVVVPQTVVVHDGVPTDRSAKDYYVPYRDYIKERGQQRDLRYLATVFHCSQCAGHYVLYPEPRLHRVVQESGV